MQRMRRKLPDLSIVAGVVAIVIVAIAATLSATEKADTKTTTNPRVQAAERLVIRYSVSGFELLSRTPLQRVLPPSVDLPATKGMVRGSWFEIQSDAGEVVYRRRIDSPRMVYTEVPTGDNPGVLKRTEVAVDENIFSVLVPAGNDAKSLIFFDSGADTQKRTEAASEVGRIGLR